MSPETSHSTYYTYSYSQPNEYRFSLDSIFLARFVASQMESGPNLDSLRVLDLCAGCGVIGIELSWHLRALQQIDFVEIQDIYTAYFKQNIAHINRPELRCNWHLLNYDELQRPEWANRYDLIVSNPPYFLEGHGMLSPSQFKNRCRFYIDSTFEHYIRALENALAINGKAYFLVRPLNHHGFDLFANIQKILADKAVRIKNMTHMRGSDIILIEKIK